MLNQNALAKNLQTVEGFYPSLLWQWFATIASIAHPSYHEEALATFIVNWAKQKNFTVWRDTVGNVIIKKPATKGMQNRTPIALQAHLDMVPQANADTIHDFAHDSLILRQSEDGRWLLATQTTLGADNGIGMASALALLQSDLPHPDLEVLLTMTEETGMVGALGLQAGTLSAPLFINTDTEEIGEIYVGCAGGLDADVNLPLTMIANSYDRAILLQIKGLKGGHSGMDIHKNRGSAIKLLARLLSALQNRCAGQFVLADLVGGTLRNAIARESYAVIAYNQQHNHALNQALSQIRCELLEQLAISEPALTIDWQTADPAALVLDSISSKKAIDLIQALPNGVVRFSDMMSDTVETSLSFGMLSLQNSQLCATLLIRSLIEADKEAVAQVIQSVADLAGAQAAFSGAYVGWNIDKQSQLVPLVADLYGEILGKPPQIKVIHAGLECGLIKKNYPDMDMVSIGPTIKNAHSPDECVDIDSVQVYWRLLTAIVANSPVRT